MIDQPNHERRTGLTLSDVAVSLAILGLLGASLVSLLAETSALLGDSDVDQAVQAEGHRAFARVGAVLRRTGRSRLNGTKYPRVSETGSEIQMRLPRQLDDDELPFDPQTGALEWGDVLTIRLEEDGRVVLRRADARVALLARDVSFLRFRTAETDPSLRADEVAMEVETRRRREDGSDAVLSFAVRIQMRNCRLPAS